MSGVDWEILASLVAIASIPVSIWAFNKLNEIETKFLHANAWSFLTVSNEKLIELREEYVDIITNGKAKPLHYRTIKEIDLAMEMQRKLHEKKL